MTDTASPSSSYFEEKARTPIPLRRDAAALTFLWIMKNVFAPWGYTRGHKLRLRPRANVREEDDEKVSVSPKYAPTPRTQELDENFPWVGT